MSRIKKIEKLSANNWHASWLNRLAPNNSPNTQAKKTRTSTTSRFVVHSVTCRRIATDPNAAIKMTALNQSNQCAECVFMPVVYNKITT